MRSPLVVNFLGGPGSGKSTLAAATFAELKWRGVNCELVTEFAKEKVWEGSLHVLEDQAYLLGKQYHRLHRLRGKVDVIVTDSPLFLLLMYGRHMGDHFAALALGLFSRFDNLNILLERHKEYNPAGRTQDEDKARSLDAELRALLSVRDLSYVEKPGVKGTEDDVADMVMGWIKSKALEARTGAVTSGTPPRCQTGN